LSNITIVPAAFDNFERAAEDYTEDPVRR